MTGRSTTVPEGSTFGLHTLPYGVFAPPGGPPRVGVAVGDGVLDLAGLAGAGLLDALDGAWAEPALNRFMAAGPATWSAVRDRLRDLLADPGGRGRVAAHLLPAAGVRMLLPFRLADYVDFYSSEAHATNVGRMFRPADPPLLPNWKRLPVGYHGRAGTVVVSGTPVVRPCGQRRGPDGDEPVFGPSVRLDIEAEVGFVVGVPSTPGRPVGVDALAEHVFGVVLVNDWSARDIQAWEYVPLGPFLAKSFATSISPWVVPLAALDAAWVPPPPQDPEPLPYLRARRPRGLDLALEVSLNGAVVSRPPFASMYWTPGQQLAHLTVNGAALRTGDLFASGTVSGWSADERGSLLELTWGGQTPLRLPDGTSRDFLADGDTVSITATAPGVDGERIGFGAVTGTVHPAVEVAG